MWYTGSSWAIFHEDGTPIPAGATYNVLGVPATTFSNGNLYVHTATAANTSGDSTYLDDSFVNNDPNAVIIATQNWNAGGSCGCVYNNHQIGVWYNSWSGRWGIFNEDGSAMPVGTSFNVEVLSSPTSGVFTQQATSTSYISFINNASTNNNPGMLLFVTPNWDVNGACGCIYDNHPLGVYYAGGEWSIYHQDIAAMTVGAAFDVFAVPLL